MTMAIERAAVAYNLMIVQSQMGRSVQYARQRMISLAAELDSPYREELMADIEALFDDEK